MLDVKTETAVSGSGPVPASTRSTPPGSFSLAHLSDLHLTSLDNIKIPQLFNKRILGYLSWRNKRRKAHRREIVNALLEDLRITSPDHIAITGDLTFLGLPEEFAEVEQWLPGLGSPDQVTLIPGNHEAYAGWDWMKSCGMWAPYLEADAGRDPQQIAGFFPSLRIRGQIALIGLCSARPSLPLLATGSLGGKQLSRLETLLKETGERGLFRVLLIHHPPAQGTVSWRKRLTDRSLFAAVLARHGAELVLHGHAHAPKLSALQTPAGNAPVIGAPSASEFSPWTANSAKYNIYRLHRSAAGWVLSMSVRSYSEDLDRFVFEKEMIVPLPHTQGIGSS